MKTQIFLFITLSLVSCGKEQVEEIPDKTSPIFVEFCPIVCTSGIDCLEVICDTLQSCADTESAPAVEEFVERNCQS